MDRKIQNHSPESPEIHDLHLEENLELLEPPFDRWLKLTDDLLGDWRYSVRNPPEQAL
jgi:hypothetical protein